MKVVEIEWTDKSLHGGSIIVDDDGVSVTTECHGCYANPLTDRREILKLYHALGDYLMATAPSSVRPSE